MTAGDLSLGEYRSAKLNILAGIEAQLTRIADNTAHTDLHLTEEQVRAAWPLRGMYEDDFVTAVKDLGITID